MKMDKMNTLLTDQSSLKRFLLTFGGLLMVALNNKFGLGLTDHHLELMVALIVPFILASNYKEAALAKAEAAKVAASATIVTPAQALEVMGGAPVAKGPQP